eukprot:GHVR01139830.1.p1 GENE.GHVR01139830.1~~GHVR01139830.1.p1  ORF type:complete len:100 (+),score=2.69 GHVR01139830.1:2136-2435(+)
MSPMFNFPNINKNSFFHKFLNLLSPSIYDNILINNMINPTALTNNPKKIKRCLSGVFNYQYVSLKMSNQYKQLSQKVIQDAYKFIYPLLVCYGGQDLMQ